MKVQQCHYSGKTLQKAPQYGQWEAYNLCLFQLVYHTSLVTFNPWIFIVEFITYLFGIRVHNMETHTLGIGLVVLTFNNFVIFLLESKRRCPFWSMAHFTLKSSILSTSQKSHRYLQKHLGFSGLTLHILL